MSEQADHQRMADEFVYARTHQQLSEHFDAKQMTVNVDSAGSDLYPTFTAFLELGMDAERVKVIMAFALRDVTFDKAGLENLNPGHFL